MTPITRREFVGSAALVVLESGRLVGAKGATGRPNLLVIHTDQLSQWALSIYAPTLKHTPNYGKTLVQTPNIDRIGREGAVLTNFFTNSAVCTPSRGCLFTGRYPTSHGAYRNNIELNRDEITIAQVLKNNGYATGYCGKWHLDGPPWPGFMKPERAMGFDDCRWMFNRGHWKKLVEDADGNPSTTGAYREIGDERSYTTDFLANQTIAFVTRQRSQPFCWVVSFPDPHSPYTVREPYMSMHKPNDMPLPRTYRAGAPLGGESDGEVARANDAKAAKRDKKAPGGLQAAKARYCGLVRCIDDNVGRILAALERKGILDNTIIVFTTDHGDYMGEHNLMGKNQWYRTAYQLPFLVRWPEKIKPGAVSERFVTNVDAQQTILGLMGIRPCGREQGRDASPLLRGEKTDWEDVAWIHHSSLQGAGVFTPKYECVVRSNGQNMLFDRENDPEQTNNLANDPAHKAVLDELKQRVIEHHRRLQTPELSWLGQAPASAANR
ncbi:sulfatase-like hydrolase/transferase [Candidatus Sumerlaeota bacterium]|nr:sulfatase-like hydrolase/transferase [Candidatus Sumerlaeota bacterium]